MLTWHYGNRHRYAIVYKDISVLDPASGLRTVYQAFPVKVYPPRKKDASARAIPPWVDEAYNLALPPAIAAVRQRYLQSYNVRQVDELRKIDTLLAENPYGEPKTRGQPVTVPLILDKAIK